jgi:hypothetical protein
VKKNIPCFAVVAAALLLAACSLTPPAAWQRGNLAKPIMAWDPDVVGVVGIAGGREKCRWIVDELGLDIARLQGRRS